MMLFWLAHNGFLPQRRRNVVAALTHKAPTALRQC
jgi:hypothetical protein